MNKIPQWARKPQEVVMHPRSTYSLAAKLLEIEASCYRDSGNAEAAKALRATARALRYIASGMAPDEAFVWPEESQS